MRGQVGWDVIGGACERGKARRGGGGKGINWVRGRADAVVEGEKMRGVDELLIKQRKGRRDV